MKSISRFTRFAVSTLAVIFLFPLLTGLVTVQNAVTIRDEGKPAVTRLTNLDKPEEILAEAGIKLGKSDTYTFQEIHDGLYRLNIDRAFDVTIVIWGTTQVVPVQGGTVADALKSGGVVLGKEDIVTPALETVLTDDTYVTVQRVSYESTTVSEHLPFETVERHTPLLKNGKTRVLENGTDGAQTTTTVKRYIDGVYAETVSETVSVTEEPYSQVTLVGDSKATVTTLETPVSLKLDANGNPTHYAKKVTGKGTAYSARDGAKTASGRYAIPGHVAVNPNVIPYGSKLYIKSQDGSFVYGYAIAADTGIALMDGRVTVDLFFDTYLESCLFGAKKMEIYVLS